MTRILFLEDSVEMAVSMLGALEIRKIDYAWATTVAEAVTIYQDEDSFDLFVLDFDLPDGTGLDFLAQMRADDESITVLFSGLDRTGELEASGLTVTHQISKSDPFALFDVIEERQA